MNFLDLTESQTPSFNDWSWTNERAILKFAPLPTSTGSAAQRTVFADTTVAERCSFQPCSGISAWSVATQIQGPSIFFYPPALRRRMAQASPQ